MSIFLFKYRFTTVNLERGTGTWTEGWCKRPVSFKRVADWQQCREDILNMHDNRENPDVAGGVLIHAELCGLKVFGIRVL